MFLVDFCPSVHSMFVGWDEGHPTVRNLLQHPLLWRVQPAKLANSYSPGKLPLNGHVVVSCVVSGRFPHIFVLLFFLVLMIIFAFYLLLRWTISIILLEIIFKAFLVVVPAVGNIRGAFKKFCNSIWCTNDTSKIFMLLFNIITFNTNAYVTVIKKVF